MFTLGFATTRSPGATVIDLIAAATGLGVIGAVDRLPARALRRVQPARDARVAAREPGRSAGVGAGDPLAASADRHPRQRSRGSTSSGRSGAPTLPRAHSTYFGSAVLPFAGPAAFVAHGAARRARLGRDVHRAVPDDVTVGGAAVPAHGVHVPADARRRVLHLHTTPTRCRTLRSSSPTTTTCAASTGSSISASRWSARPEESWPALPRLACELRGHGDGAGRADRRDARTVDGRTWRRRSYDPDRSVPSTARRTNRTGRSSRSRGATRRVSQGSEGGADEGEVLAHVVDGPRRLADHRRLRRREHVPHLVRRDLALRPGSCDGHVLCRIGPSSRCSGRGRCVR